MGKLLVDELEESLGVGRGLDEAGFVDGGIAHCWIGVERSDRRRGEEEN